jgi:hypothetical protein
MDDAQSHSLDQRTAFRRAFLLGAMALAVAILAACVLLNDKLTVAEAKLIGVWKLESNVGFVLDLRPDRRWGLYDPTGQFTSLETGRWNIRGGQFVLTWDSDPRTWTQFVRQLAEDPKEVLFREPVSGRYEIALVEEERLTVKNEGGRVVQWTRQQ